MGRHVTCGRRADWLMHAPSKGLHKAVRFVPGLATDLWPSVIFFCFRVERASPPDCCHLVVLSLSHSLLSLQLPSGGFVEI